MCCFTRPVELVANTNIFARSSKEGRQFIVYSMNVRMREDLAMILPIPVPAGSPDDAVRFINLKEYPNFFADMQRGFPEPASRRKDTVTTAVPPPKAALPVVEVGDFEASFVPSVQDFARLDQRFRLPDAAWDQLPQYKNYGFAVFKLKKSEANPKKIHPMAFEFPRAASHQSRLFFPTVHIHDGMVHSEAHFDHTLYCQTTSGEKLPIMTWAESPQLATQFLKMDKTQGIVDGDSHCYRRTIRGNQKNEDILI